MQMGSMKLIILPIYFFLIFRHYKNSCECTTTILSWLFYLK